VIEKVFAAGPLGNGFHIAESAFHVRLAEAPDLDNAHPVIVFAVEQMMREEAPV
jgi:hypothetical protein